MSTPDSKINYTLANEVSVIRLNDPDTLNAMTEAMARELFDALGRGEREGRAILLCAAGRGFCSGANMSGSHFDMADPARDVGRSLEDITNPILLRMRASEVPIVAAVRGPVVGVGCGLALSADLIVAGDRSYFFQSFSKIGLVPDGGASYLLPRAIGRARAMEMMLLGPKIPAAQALEWGLVNRVVPEEDVDDAAGAIAAQLAAGPGSLGMTRRLAWAALDKDLEAAIAAEREKQRDAGRTGDFAEGVASFLEKRKPTFRGN